MRVGIGFDAHALVEGKKLILGGVHIPYRHGLEGHSDADVLSHAVMDALLGASGEKDIGRVFPDSEPQYKKISSLLLMEKVKEVLQGKGWKIMNIDTVVCAQAPKLSPFFDEMEENIARALCIAKEQIHVKATTTEGLGFTGRKEGVSAYAVALISMNEMS